MAKNGWYGFVAAADVEDSFARRLGSLRAQPLGQRPPYGPAGVGLVWASLTLAGCHGRGRVVPQRRAETDGEPEHRLDRRAREQPGAREHGDRDDQRGERHDGAVPELAVGALRDANRDA